MRIGTPGMSKGGARATRPGALLALIYVLCTLVHIWLLWEPSLFPHISSDEVQYSAVGESLRAGRGFTVHGGFHPSIPPLYPALIALAHSIGPDPRASMLVAGCLVMCAAVFPAFAIARYLGIGWGSAHLLAAAAAFLPHTIYAGTYMPEALQYPLFLTAFFLVLRWLDCPSDARDLLLGFTLGCTLLTKVQGLQLIGAFLLTLIAHVVCVRGNRAAVSRHAAIVMAVVVAMAGAWIAFKAAHGASVAGAGYERSMSGGLIHWTWRLAVAYFADFALAPGLLTLVPLLFWVRDTGKKNFVRAFFVSAVLLIQIVAVSTLDGGLTGWLRERLFLYSLPLAGILAVSGLEGLTEQTRRRLAVVSIAIAPVLLGALLLYPFHVSSVIEIPWANAMGSLPSGFTLFTKWNLVAISLAAALAGTVAMGVPRKRSPVWFAAFLLAFHICGFAASSKGLANWSRMRQPEIVDVLGWLSAHRVPAGRRLLIAGRPTSDSGPRTSDTPPPRDTLLRIGYQRFLASG